MHGDQYTFLSYLVRFFLLLEMFHTKVIEKIKAHILGSIIFFSEKSAVYEIMLKNIVGPDTQQMTIWSMRFACWVPKPSKTLSEYAVHIALPLQQWLDVGASVLCYTCITCLVIK